LTVAPQAACGGLSPIPRKITGYRQYLVPFLGSDPVPRSSTAYRIRLPLAPPIVIAPVYAQFRQHFTPVPGLVFHLSQNINLLKNTVEFFSRSFS
jgi:hypothetical protein